MSVLYVDGRAPRVLPAYVLPDVERGERTLAILTRPIGFNTRFGYVEVPEGYTTDFASIPRLVAWRIRPLDRHAWAAVLHDWRYAVGEPGKKHIADQMFLDQMKADGVNAIRRTVMYEAVHNFGHAGYQKAPKWWATENFRDVDTGEPVPPPFSRIDAFDGQARGLRKNL